MIGRIILALIAFAAVMAVFQMAFVALIVAGLIFRTRETVGLLLLFGLLGLLDTHPWIAVGILALAAFGAIAHAWRKAPPPRGPQLLLPPPTGSETNP